MFTKVNPELAIRDVTITPSDIREFIPTVRDNGLMRAAQNMFIYVYEGEFIYSIDDVTHLVMPHNMVLIPKDTPYFQHCTFSKNFKAMKCRIASTFNGGTDFFQFFNIKPRDYVVTIKNYERMEACIESFLHDPDFSSDLCYQLNRISKFPEMLALFFESAQVTFQNNRTWESLLQFMEENLDKDVPISTFASIVSLHENYFIKVFRDAFGTSPMKYFNRMKLKKAISLLSDTDLHTNTIAARIGIDDPNYFSSFFKKNCGISPREFRKLVKRMRNEKEDL